MKASRIVTAVATSVVAGWLTDQAMKKAALPPAVRPLVSIGAAAAVAEVVRRIR